MSKGEIEEAQGRNRQAIADYKKAVALQPAPEAGCRGLQRSPPIRQRRGPRDAGAGIDSWRVVQHGTRYYRQRPVPPVCAFRWNGGDGQPQLLEWEVKHRRSRARLPSLHRRRRAGCHGPEEFEQIAILDLDSNS